MRHNLQRLTKGDFMEHQANELVALVVAIVVLGYSVQELLTMYLFSEEEIKEMNKNKEQQ